MLSSLYSHFYIVILFNSLPCINSTNIGTSLSCRKPFQTGNLYFVRPAFSSKQEQNKLLLLLLNLLDVFNPDSAAPSRAEGSWFLPCWTLPGNDQRLQEEQEVEWANNEISEHPSGSHLYIHIVMDLSCSSDIKTRSPRGHKANFKDNAAYFIRFCISALLLLIGLLSLLYVCAPESRRTIALVEQPDRRGGGEVCAWWFGPELRDERWEQDLLSSTVLCFHWGTLCSL